MSKSASILIADDELSFRKSTSRLLQKEGFQCHEAEDSEKALAILQKNCYDVLLADIRMPHNQGLQFARKALELDKRMAVIVITGYPTTSTAIQAVELPIAAYLTKPLDSEELLQHIKDALKSSPQRRAIAAAIERLQSVILDLETTQSRPQTYEHETKPIPLETLRTLATCLSQLLELSVKSPSDHISRNLCDFLDCQHKSTYRQAIFETVEVLKTTKHLFKSKVLAELRTKLEGLLES